jgi:hypothetical protein
MSNLQASVLLARVERVDVPPGMLRALSFMETFLSR